MNVLLIGNSYTSRNDLANLLETLCRENGKDVTVRSDFSLFVSKH